MTEKKNGRPKKYRLDYHSPFHKIMATAAENEITVTNDIKRPGKCSLYYHNQKGNGTRCTVEHKDVGAAVQRILDMRDGIVPIQTTK